MKTYFKIIILIFLFFGVFFSSCKKYEEGPCISFRKPINRLYGGYQIKEYTVDGVDSLTLLHDSIGLHIEFFTSEVDNFNVMEMNGNNKGDLIWLWSLSVDGLYLEVGNSGGHLIGTGPFGKNRNPTWKIIKLTNKKVKMRTTYNNKEYVVYMD
jgi:hypothetical protein